MSKRRGTPAGAGRAAPRGEAARRRPASAPQAVEAHGWTILAHPLFIEQIEKLASTVEAETRKTGHGAAGPNAKLLAHLIDLAFDKIPRDPGNPSFRQGKTLGRSRQHWFRAKTGNGRYRLFYRFQSSARLIVYAWVNDGQSLRTRGSSTDAYAVFAGMLDRGKPPDDWPKLLAAASGTDAVARLRRARRRPR